MQSDNKNLHLIPVHINYERLFEIRNLAIEMVSGEVPDVGLKKVIGMIDESQAKSLGKVFLLFGQPVSVKEHLAASKLLPLTP